MGARSRGLVASGTTRGRWARSCLALAVYFVIAIGMHVRVRDTFTNTIGAVSMLGFVLVVGFVSYAPAI